MRFSVYPSRIFAVAAVFLAATSAMAAEKSSAKEPASSADMNVCQFVAKQVSNQVWSSQHDANPARDTGNFARDFLVRSGIFDVDGDGKPDFVEPSQMVGTMGGTKYIDLVLSSANGKPLESREVSSALTKEEQNIEEVIGRWALGWGWLPFKGRWYEVGFADEGGSFPYVVRYYDDTGHQHLACAFENTASEQSYWTGLGYGGPLQTEVRACQAVAKELPMEPIAPVERLADDKAEAIAKQLGDQKSPWAPSPWCKYDTRCKNVWGADFDNDGQTERLLKIEISSGAGRGCDAQYYVALTPSGELDPGAKEQALLALQHITDTNQYPDNCRGLVSNWIKVGDRIYLERQPNKGRARNTGTLVHTLSLALGPKTDTLCGAVFKVTPQITYENPPK